MIDKICVCVIGNTIKQFLKNLIKAQKISSSLIELRVDYIKKLSISDLYLIRNKTKNPAIFTCRKKSEGGFYENDEMSRIKIIKVADELNFKFLDIELTTLKKYSNFIHPLKTKLIVSYHNFNSTPSLNFLTRLGKEMIEFKPKIIKIATFVNKYQDIKNLFNFLLNDNLAIKKIVIGIGKKGTIFRILAPFFNSYLTYVSLDNYKKTASGQLSFDKILKIYQLLKSYVE